MLHSSEIQICSVNGEDIADDSGLKADLVLMISSRSDGRTLVNLGICYMTIIHQIGYDSCLMHDFRI